MSRDVITLSSGKEFPCKYLNSFNGNMLFINVDMDNMTEILNYFTDINETRTISFKDVEFRGFTNFQSISKTPAGFYRVVLMKQNEE